MHEFDLIPADYRQAQRRRRWLVAAGAVLLALLLVTGGARWWLQHAITQAQPHVAALQAGAARSAALRSEWMALRQQTEQAQAQLRKLQQLRRGLAWPQALAAIDQAWSPRLWLDQLELTAEPDAVLLLKGHALEHGSLTAFMRALGAQPGMGEPRLLHTGLRRYTDVDAVDFELSVPLKAAVPGEPR